MSLQKELSGTDKESVYRQLASELNGSFVTGDYYNPVKVHVPYKNWIITIDTAVVYDVLRPASSNPYGGNDEITRIRVPYVKEGEFVFSVYNTGVSDLIADFFGARDIVVGDPAFDSRFTIKGTDEQQVRTLFADESIRKALTALNSVHLKIRTDDGAHGIVIPENVNELFYKAEDVILDLPGLKLLFHLFTLLLDRLCEIKAATSVKPGVILT